MHELLADNVRKQASVAANPAGRKRQRRKDTGIGCCAEVVRNVCEMNEKLEMLVALRNFMIYLAKCYLRELSHFVPRLFSNFR